MNEKTKQLTVKKIMQKEVHTVYPDQTVFDAAHRDRGYRQGGDGCRGSRLRDVEGPPPPPHAQARAARRAQDRSVRSRLRAAAHRRHAAHRAGEDPAAIGSDDRELSALRLLLRRPRARARHALARALQ